MRTYFCVGEYDLCYVGSIEWTYMLLQGLFTHKDKVNWMNLYMWSSNQGSTGITKISNVA